MKQGPRLIIALFLITSLACNMGTFYQLFSTGREGDEELISTREAATSATLDAESTATEEALDVLKAEATQTAISLSDNKIGQDCTGLSYEECSVVGLHQFDVEYVSFQELCSIPSNQQAAPYEWRFSSDVATWHSSGEVIGTFARVSGNSYARASEAGVACEELEFYENGFQCVTYDLEGDLCTLSNHNRVDP